MQTVEVTKTQLKKTLEENLETHQKDFEIAWTAFREKAIENFEERLRAIKSARKGEQINLHVGLTVPEDHSEDYVRALEMLKWEVGDTVKLEEHEFQQLVQDDWGWSRSFKFSNMSYTGSESPSARRR